MRNKITITFKDSSVKVAYVKNLEDIDKREIKSIEDSENKVIWEDSSIHYLRPITLKKYIEMFTPALKGKVDISALKEGVRGNASYTAVNRCGGIIANMENGKKVKVHYSIDDDFGGLGDDEGYVYYIGRTSYPCRDEFEFCKNVGKLLLGEEVKED